MNDAKDVLKDKNIILVKEEIVVLGARVAFFAVIVIDALDACLCEIIE